MHHLAKGGADPGELEHQPLNRLVSFGRAGREKAAEFVGEVHQNCARLKHREGLAAGTFVIDDHRYLGIGIEGGEFWLELLAFPDIHRDRAIGRREFLQRDEDFLYVGAGQDVEIDHGARLAVAGRPQTYRGASRPASNRDKEAARGRYAIDRSMRPAPSPPPGVAAGRASVATCSDPSSSAKLSER